MIDKIINFFTNPTFIKILTNPLFIKICTIIILLIFLNYIIKLIIRIYKKNQKNRIPSDIPSEILDKFKVTLYAYEISSHRSASYKVKKFLDNKWIKHSFRDLKSDRHMKEMIKITKQRKYPVLIYNFESRPEKFIIGYNKRKLKKFFKELYKLCRKSTNIYYRI